MEARRLLPYIIVLLVLAFALGSLPRSEPGGSVFFHSYWLLYLIYIAPFAILGLMAALIILITINWRSLSEGIGFGLGQRRRQRKGRSQGSLLISAVFWALAIGVLFARCGGIFCGTATNSTSYKVLILGENATAPDPLQIGNALPVLSTLVKESWFSLAFLGLVVVSSVIILQSIRVSMRDQSRLSQEVFQRNQEEGLQALQEAMKLVDDATLDPRSRIISCYQHLIATTLKLGAPISSDQTARELERGIRSMFGLKGESIHELTQLFEEARYSLHEITETDARDANEYLHSIAGELDIS